MTPAKRERPASSTLMLHRARGEQLRQIAASRQETVVDVLEGFIRSQIDQGVIPDEVPGFTVALRNDLVVMITPAFVTPAMTPVHALELASALEAVADRTADGGKSLTFANDGCKLQIARAGASGLVFARVDLDGMVQGKCGITSSIARDVARQIRAALN